MASPRTIARDALTAALRTARRAAARLDKTGASLEAEARKAADAWKKARKSGAPLEKATRKSKTPVSLKALGL